MAKWEAIYCVMGPERETNSAGHTFVALAKMGSTGEMELEATLGYYAMPPTKVAIKSLNDLISPTVLVDWLTSMLKKASSINYDLNGNHGWFKSEKPHQVNSPYSMRAKRIEITEEQYEQLKTQFHHLKATQEKAVNENAAALQLVPMTDKVRFHPFENKSLRIYEHEKKTRGALSRLKPFEFTFVYLNRLALPPVNNCKVQALHLLEDILSPEEIQLLKGWSKTIPRFGKLDRVFFELDAPMCRYEKKPGEYVYSRKKESDVPVRVVEYTQNKPILQLVESLRRIQWLLEQPDFLHAEKDKLVTHIKDHYSCFAHPAISSHRAWGLFTTYKVKDHIQNAKCLLDVLYAATIDEYDHDAIDTKDPFDLPFIVIPHLPIDKKKELCNILGKAYMDVSARKESVKQVAKIKTM